MPLSPPILSICIPTFNRADLLDLCLATVLPQVAEHADRVECVIRDNASPDHTAEVIDRYEQEYPLRRHRNEENLGGLINVLDVVLKQATGEYIWLIGDDDTLKAGAVERILDFLDAHRDADPDLVTINVDYLPEDLRPLVPIALGGITLAGRRFLRNPGSNSGIIPFEDLFEGPCGDFTAMYSFVVRQRCWQDSLGKWKPPQGNPFVSVRGTYPHACVVADCLPGKQAGRISEPLVTVFELAPDDFLWARHYPLNTLVWAGALLRLFEKRGVPRDRLSPCREYLVWSARSKLSALLWDRRYAGGWMDFFRLFRNLPGYRTQLLGALVHASGADPAPSGWRWFNRAVNFSQRLHAYLFYQCRPARSWRLRRRR